MTSPAPSILGSLAPAVEASDGLLCDDDRYAVRVCWAVLSSRDSVGDLSTAQGIDYARHKANSLAYFDHGAKPPFTLPIGSTTSPEGTYDVWQEGDRLYAWVYLVRGESEHARRVADLYDLCKRGVIKGGSYGYRVLDALPLPPDYSRCINHCSNLLLRHVELLEISIVAVPAHADAVKGKALDFDPQSDVYAEERREHARRHHQEHAAHGRKDIDQGERVTVWGVRGNLIDVTDAHGNLVTLELTDEPTVESKGAAGLPSYIAVPKPPEEVRMERTRPRPPASLNRGSLGKRPPKPPSAGAPMKALRDYYKALPWDESKHPRGQPGNAGQFSSAPTGGRTAKPAAAGGDQDRPAHGKRKPLTATKGGGRMASFTDIARRRRVIAAYAAERELADATEGLQHPDSEAYDVTILALPDGELVRDLDRAKHHLRIRENVVKLLNRGDITGEQAQKYRDWLTGHTLILLECKALLTQKGTGEIRMSAKAAERKRRVEKRYAANFYTVALDLRKRGGAKRHDLYIKKGVGNAALGTMSRVESYNDLLAHIQRETPQ